MATNAGMPEPPVALTAKTVVRTDFRQVRRGFDPEEVTAHLGRVAEHVADLEAMSADLRIELRKREAAGAPDELARTEAYRTAATRIADLIRTFDQDMESMRAQREAEVETRVAEARATAERIEAESEKMRAEAEWEAGRMVNEARETAARVRADADQTANEALGSLQARRNALLENMRQIREALGRMGES